MARALFTYKQSPPIFFPLRSIDITSSPEWSQKKANHHRTESDVGWHVYSSE
jgi:hypothetical protein